LNPRIGEVYNIGGSRHSNISMLESIDKVSNILGTKLDYTISKDNRIGDHIWYISDVTKFKDHYPNWDYKYDIDMIINEMVNSELK
jgi:CDP-paratose 2-epimerase